MNLLFGKEIVGAGASIGFGLGIILFQSDALEIGAGSVCPRGGSAKTLVTALTEIINPATTALFICNSLWRFAVIFADSRRIVAASLLVLVFDPDEADVLVVDADYSRIKSCICDRLVRTD